MKSIVPDVAVGRLFVDAGFRGKSNSVLSFSCLWTNLTLGCVCWCGRVVVIGGSWVGSGLSKVRFIFFIMIAENSRRDPTIRQWRECLKHSFPI